MAVLDPEEVEVWCLDCCAKLHNDSIYACPSGTTRCPSPDQCRKERDELEQERRYGR